MLIILSLLVILTIGAISATENVNTDDKQKIETMVECEGFHDNQPQNIPTLEYGQTKKLYFLLKEIETDRGISGKKITVKVNGKTHTAITNSKGVGYINLTANLIPKPSRFYRMTAKFAGDNKYEKSVDDDVRYTIVKAKTKINSNNNKFKAKSSKKITATLSSNGAVLKNQKVKLNINKKTITKNTNSKGKVTFDVTKILPKTKAKYNAKIKFSTNKYYTGTTKNIKISVTK